MNILILGQWDHSGAGNALMQAVNEHTEHSARQACYEESYLGYPVDVKSPTPTELRELWEWADVVNIHDAADYLIPVGATPKAQIATYHGTTYRERWPYFNLFDRDRGRLATALNLDLAMVGPRWLPRPQPDLSGMRGARNSGPFRVAHAPTNRRIKDTETVIKQLKDCPGVELVLIENVDNAECLRIKATCDVLVEEFQLGYGTNAIETWATGMPVVACAWPGILNYMRHKLEALPFVETPLGKLRETVELLRDDRMAYEEAQQRGRAYWEAWHEPGVAAARFVAMCEEVLTMEVF